MSAESLSALPSCCLVVRLQNVPTQSSCWIGSELIFSVNTRRKALDPRLSAGAVFVFEVQDPSHHRFSVSTVDEASRVLWEYHLADLPRDIPVQTTVLISDADITDGSLELQLTAIGFGLTEKTIQLQESEGRRSIRLEESRTFTSLWSSFRGEHLLQQFDDLISEESRLRERIVRARAVDWSDSLITSMVASVPPEIIRTVSDRQRKHLARLWRKELRVLLANSESMVRAGIFEMEEMERRALHLKFTDILKRLLGSLGAIPTLVKQESQMRGQLYNDWFKAFDSLGKRFELHRNAIVARQSQKDNQAAELRKRVVSLQDSETLERAQLSARQTAAFQSFLRTVKGVLSHAMSLQRSIDVLSSAEASARRNIVRSSEREWSAGLFALNNALGELRQPDPNTGDQNVEEDDLSFIEEFLSEEGIHKSPSYRLKSISKAKPIVDASSDDNVETANQRDRHSVLNHAEQSGRATVQETESILRGHLSAEMSNGCLSILARHAVLDGYKQALNQLLSEEVNGRKYIKMDQEGHFGDLSADYRLFRVRPTHYTQNFVPFHQRPDVRRRTMVSSAQLARSSNPTTLLSLETDEDIQRQILQTASIASAQTLFDIKDRLGVLTEESQNRQRFEALFLRRLSKLGAFREQIWKDMEIEESEARRAIVQSEERHYEELRSKEWSRRMILMAPIRRFTTKQFTFATDLRLDAASNLTPDPTKATITSAALVPWSLRPQSAPALLVGRRRPTTIDIRVHKARRKRREVLNAVKWRFETPMGLCRPPLCPEWCATAPNPISSAKMDLVTEVRQAPLPDLQRKKPFPCIVFPFRTPPPTSHGPYRPASAYNGVLRSSWQMDI